MEIIIFDVFCLNIEKISFVLNKIVNDTRKRISSRKIFAKLSIPKFKPYIFIDTGQSNWIPPVKKSPTKICWMTTKK